MEIPDDVPENIKKIVEKLDEILVGLGVDETSANAVVMSTLNYLRSCDKDTDPIEVITTATFAYSVVVMSLTNLPVLEIAKEMQFWIDKFPQSDTGIPSYAIRLSSQAGKLVSTFIDLHEDRDPETVYDGVVAVLGRINCTFLIAGVILSVLGHRATEVLNELTVEKRMADADGNELPPDDDADGIPTEEISFPLQEIPKSKMNVSEFFKNFHLN